MRRQQQLVLLAPRGALLALIGSVLALAVPGGAQAAPTCVTAAAGCHWRCQKPGSARSRV